MFRFNASGCEEEVSDWRAVMDPEPGSSSPTMMHPTTAKNKKNVRAGNSYDPEVTSQVLDGFRMRTEALESA